MNVPEWIRQGRAKWRYRGQERPPFALKPRAGQESVWDYPRPPRLSPDPREVVVRLGHCEIARTTRSVRILETASPPTFYLPPGDVDSRYLEAASGSSLCEWKGAAQYWSLITPDERAEQAAWSYPEPFAEFADIAGYLSFYPARLDCFVGGVRVEPQPGSFYGGWVTPDVVGPFKGEPGSQAW